MFEKILVANRGEIAVRIMRTAREMGVGTVAVYSEADENSLHVLSADEAVCLGGSDPLESYLNIDKIISAAKETRAQAIHPGYGFLAENADFARQVNNAGLVFIGPSPETIASLGDKTQARTMMQKGGVPIIPGMTSPDSNPDNLIKAAEKIGYPVLIKAAAGGGGKGMRVVDSPDQLAEAAKQAASEARSAFGDGSIYLEKYINKPRHVEFQILADEHGNAVHIFERECSIQRRHQKIIEETPCVVLDDVLREKMGKAAVAATKAANYTNAGTVEFLIDTDGQFYFLEVNTRLQVEHPITEMITGLDIVRLQLEIASGGALPFEQNSLSRHGHAIECRIYAEAPEENFLPSPGNILFFQEPSGPGLRFDGGIYSGFEVPVHYDPILGKLIAWGPDRDSAISRMIRGLQECVVLGISTPCEFMIDVLASEPFQNGMTFTDFIPEHFANWKPGEKGDRFACMAYAAKDLVMPRTSSTDTSAKQNSGIPSPWQTLGNWDLVK